MPRYHFHIQENGRFIPDEEGREFASTDAVRKEAVAAGASIARDAFICGNTKRVVVDVRREDEPFMKVSITLSVEE